jgi:hypothetical protein
MMNMRVLTFISVLTVSTATSRVAHAAPLVPRVFSADACSALLDPSGTSITSDLEGALKLARRPDFQEWVATVRSAKLDELPTVDPHLLLDRREVPKNPYTEKGDSRVEAYLATYRGRTVFVKAADPTARRTMAYNEIRNSLITAALRITPFHYGSFKDSKGLLHLVFDLLPVAPLSMDDKWILGNGSEGPVQPLPFPVTPAHIACMGKLGEILEAIGYQSTGDFQTRLYPDGTAVLFDVERTSFELSHHPLTGEQLPSVVRLNIRDKIGWLEQAIRRASEPSPP